MKITKHLKIELYNNSTSPEQNKDNEKFQSKSINKNLQILKINNSYDKQKNTSKNNSFFK